AIEPRAWMRRAPSARAGCAVDSVLEPARQFMLRHSLARSQGHLVDDTDIARELERGQVIRRPLDNGSRVDRLPTRARHEKEDVRLTDLRRHADDGASIDVRMPGDDVLHLPCGDVLTADPDAVAGPTHEV